MLSELHEFDWLRGSFFTGASGSARTVRDFLPARFDRYLRMFPPVLCRNGSGPASTTWRELAARKGVQIQPDTTWAQLAGPSKVSSDFSVVVRDRSIDPPWSGVISPGCLRALASSLATGRDGMVWVGVWRGFAGGIWCETDFRQLCTPNREFGVWEVLFADIDRFEVSAEGWGLRFGPSLVWPASQAWIAYSDIDSYTTFVGCSNQHAERLLAADAETLELAPETQVVGL